MQVPPERESLLWQLRMATSLFAVVTSELSDGEALHPPAASAWTVHRDDDGEWTADWSDEEPDPAPATTIAWLLWHIGWWWSDVTERAFGHGPVSRTDAPWPGSVSAALERIASCRERWEAGVSQAPAEQLHPWSWRTDVGR